MSAWNTNYGIAPVGDDTLRRTFGSLYEAFRLTGGDLHVILLYIHNPERIASAPEVEPQHTPYANALKDSAEVEKARASFDGTVIGVAREMGIGRDKARELLKAAGVWPKPQPQPQQVSA